MCIYREAFIAKHTEKTTNYFIFVYEWNEHGKLPISNSSVEKKAKEQRKKFTLNRNENRKLSENGNPNRVLMRNGHSSNTIKFARCLWQSSCVIIGSFSVIIFAFESISSSSSISKLSHIPTILIFRSIRYIVVTCTLRCGDYFETNIFPSSLFSVAFRLYVSDSSSLDPFSSSKYNWWECFDVIWRKRKKYGQSLTSNKSSKSNRIEYDEKERKNPQVE